MYCYHVYNVELTFKDGDSDSERSDRLVPSLVAGPALLQYDDTAEVVTDEDADEDDEDDYGKCYATYSIID